MARRPAAPHPTAASVDPAEIARFAALAEEWWDANGKFRPLHKLNPVRLAYIRDNLCRHFARPPLRPAPLQGLRVLDIGCGGGLIAEPLARLGAAVVGIDAGAPNVEVARHHARQSGLAIDYRHRAAEELAAAGESFDCVLALEVVEHVADLDSFLGAAAALTKPGGCLVIATLNRTARAFLLAIVGAEYVLGWLARGTHDWSKFVRPSELASALRGRGVEIAGLDGISYDPLAGAWRPSRDLGVNYMAFARKRPVSP
ncbi:MAG: bifunctional 2-polyprenyl-6-hydroxyphenol methylase/3-demethylubiquinol 3-O-methyltransferase UbiG [Pseudomonadota bacterium]